MYSKKTRHKTSRHSTPTPSTSGGGNSTLSSLSALHSQPTPISPSSTNINSSHHSLSPTYHALTPQVRYEHDHSQNSPHENPHYIHTVQNHHIHRLGANLHNLGVELPAYVHAKVVQDSGGMTPIEGFAAHSTYPYQQYSSYQPIPKSKHDSQPPGPYTRLANDAHQPEAQQDAQQDAQITLSVHGEASNSGREQVHGRNVVYFAPHQEYYLQTIAQGNAPGPGDDLAAVGTQFDSYFQSGYGQTF